MVLRDGLALGLPSRGLLYDCENRWIVAALLVTDCSWQVTAVSPMSHVNTATTNHTVTALPEQSGPTADRCWSSTLPSILW